MTEQLQPIRRRIAILAVAASGLGLAPTASQAAATSYGAGLASPARERSNLHTTLKAGALHAGAASAAGGSPSGLHGVRMDH